MVDVTVRVDGFRELDAKLAQFKKGVGKAILRRVAVKALKPFDDAWRAKAPHLSGELKESGGVGTKLTKRQARLNKKRDDKSSVEVFAGPSNPAAVPQEFGTVDQRAQPFVRPAWDATKDQVLTNVKTGLAAEIDKVAERQRIRAARRGGST